MRLTLQLSQIRWLSVEACFMPGLTEAALPSQKHDQTHPACRLFAVAESKKATSSARHPSPLSFFICLPSLCWFSLGFLLCICYLPQVFSVSDLLFCIILPQLGCMSLGLPAVGPQTNRFRLERCSIETEWTPLWHSTFRKLLYQPLCSKYVGFANCSGAELRVL